MSEEDVEKELKDIPFTRSTDRKLATWGPCPVLNTWNYKLFIGEDGPEYWITINKETGRVQSFNRKL